MRDSQRQPSFVPYSVVVDAAAQSQNVVFDSELQFEPPDWGQEEEWGRRLHSLQECICELLLKNQQLRMMSLNSITDGQCKQSIPLLLGTTPKP